MDRFAKDLDSDLSVYHLVPLSLRTTHVLTSAIPENIPAHHHPGTLDGIRRITLDRTPHQHPQSEERKQLIKTIYHAQ
jgi:hypothetical protein